LFAGGRGSGKCLDKNTPICTNIGWKNLEDVRIGDIVFDERGNQVNVTWVSDILYGHKCYEITFSDDSVLIADKEHLWLTLTAATRKSFGRRTGHQNKSFKLLEQNLPKYDYEIF